MITIPGYKVSSLLSECTRAVVYRAVRLEDQTPVAIKMLRPEQATDENVEMLRHESDVTGRLQLDGVARCLAFENGDRGPLLVLEDFGAVPLTELIEPSGLSIDLFYPIAGRLAAILIELHGLGIVHNDINPSNILINRESGVVKLTGFGLAGSGRGGHVIPMSSLAYSSPEQTGRMDRGVDSRTDLYSLGIVLYQILAGRLPFSSADPLEIIHSHIALEPDHLCRLNPAVPEALSDIVMKLLAKNPIDRYQSGFGLSADLEVSRERQRTGERERFALGLRDVPHSFSTDGRLYGREREISELITAVERVGQGAKELLLVSGLPGIGKTALIDEFRKRISAGTPCMFTSGKFDLSKRNVPYSGFIVAFKALIRRILTKNERKVRAWKEGLLQALGANGQIMIQVIPELELIIGRQPAPSPAGPIESLNRFNRTIQKFISVFAVQEHPLVLFLDDLQWADPASLNLMKILATDPQIDHLLLIGAYRENEIDAAHPLRPFLDFLVQTSMPLGQIHLPPLTAHQVNELISNTLRCGPERSEPLARTVHAKTGGSPFFVNQMLALFSDEKMLRYDPARGWSWSLDEINQLDVAGNVIDLLIGKIAKLASASQQVLKLASCIGNRFNLETLEMVYEQPSTRTLADLGPALEEGLVVITSQDYYLFSHDRIHEAVYSLIPAEEKQRTHYRIGMLALERTKQEQVREKVFYLTDHLNAGADLIPDQDGRYRLAELNLVAGKKAKASAAYESAVRYLSSGIARLAGDSWAVHYGLTMDLHRHCSECQYLCGNFDEAEHLFSVIERNARTPLERAWTYSIRVPLAHSRGKAEDAFRYGVEGLRLLGYEMPLHPGKLALAAELVKMKWHAKWHGPEHFLDLPATQDPRKKAISHIVSELCLPAYCISQDLFSLMMLTSFNLSVRNGNTPSSPMGYGMYAMILGSVFGDYKKGYNFGIMALNLAERLNDPKSKAFANFMLSSAIAHWRVPFYQCKDFCVNGYAVGFESGSFTYGSYCAGLHTAHMTFKGDRLEDVEAQCGKYLDALNKAGGEEMTLAIKGLLRMSFLLSGRGKESTGFCSDNFDEDGHIRTLREENRFLLLCLYYTFRLPALYLLGAYDQALRVGDEVDALANFLLGLPHSVQCNFYQSLTAAALYAGSGGGDRKKYARILKRNRARMKKWAASCPDNYRNKHLLVSAEWARLRNRTIEAEELYDESIRAAREQKFIHEEALANELAARFHLSRNRTVAGRAYLGEAIACYERWGAAAKAKQLEERYAQLPASSAEKTASAAVAALSSGPSAPGSPALDLATVLKTSQAISGEISLDRLLRELMRIVIETAGARRGLLILVRDGRLCLEAEGDAETAQFSVLPSLPLEGSDRAAESIVLYVARTQEPVVLNDALEEGLFIQDPYIRKHRSRSILCLPIINKRLMTGILYLENDLASHSFTASRVALLEALSSQIAISLENARLYEEAVRIKESLGESEQKFRTLAETMKAGIVIYRENEFLYVNSETEAITGYTRDEFSRMRFDRIIHPDHLYMVGKRAADRLAGRPAPDQYEFKIVRKDGGERWLMSTAARIRYGREDALITALVDITSQKEAEQERVRLYEENVRHYRERIEEERRHQREKENILMDIHDGIGGITTNIRLLAEVAQKAPAPEEVKSRLSTISQLARDGNAEIRTLMFSLDNRDHTWQALVAELRSSGSKLLGPHEVGFEMSIEIEESAPAPGNLLFLHLFRVYREALTNVVKHADASAVKAELRLDRERLLLMVCDDGRGCDPEAISGKGRGVNNMKKRAAALGGSLTITSGKGTCVALAIPRSQLPLGT